MALRAAKKTTNSLPIPHVWNSFVPISHQFMNRYKIFDFTSNLLRSLIIIIVLSISAQNTQAAPSLPTVIKEQYALIIGISNYDKWPHLPNAVINARKMACLLENNGFNVTLLSDPDADTLKKAIQEISLLMGQNPDSSMFLYYSGQGESTQNTKGEWVGWIIPSNCPRWQEDPDGFTRKAISTKQLSEESIKIKSRQVLMVFDTSFSADAFRIKKPSLRLPGATTNLPIRQYIVAGRQHEPIPDKSLFAQYLFNALLGEADSIKDDYITGSELSVYLSVELSRKDKGNRHLQYAVHGDPAFGKGDFVLEVLHPSRKSGCLYVDVQPKTADIRILNIRPKFKQGMKLETGKYHISVSAAGCRTHTKWITLKGGEPLSVKMTLEATVPEKVNSIGMQFKWIDAASFYMGQKTSSNYFVDNESQHTVRLTQGFYIQIKEVTNDQFAQFINDTKYRTDAEKSGCWVYDHQRWRKQKGVTWQTPSWKKKAPNTFVNMPVTCVSWNDAKRFTHWLAQKEKINYALPSEAQWEFACRADTKTPFAFGNCLTTKQSHHMGGDSFFKKCSVKTDTRHDSPLPVGSLSPNAWQLHDMHGNVSEWCRDWYGPYPDKKVKDPLGPSQGVEKVIRGGHFLNMANECRSSRRQSFPPHEAASVIGFRTIIVPSK